MADEEYVDMALVLAEAERQRRRGGGTSPPSYLNQRTTPVSRYAPYTRPFGRRATTPSEDGISPEDLMAGLEVDSRSSSDAASSADAPTDDEEDDAPAPYHPYDDDPRFAPDPRLDRVRTQEAMQRAELLQGKIQNAEPMSAEEKEQIKVLARGQTYREFLKTIRKDRYRMRVQPVCSKLEWEIRQAFGLDPGCADCVFCEYPAVVVSSELSTSVRRLYTRYLQQMLFMHPIKLATSIANEFNNDIRPELHTRQRSEIYRKDKTLTEEQIEARLSKKMTPAHVWYHFDEHSLDPAYWIGKRLLEQRDNLKLLQQKARLLDSFGEDPNEHIDPDIFKQIVAGERQMLLLLKTDPGKFFFGSKHSTDAIASASVLPTQIIADTRMQSEDSMALFQ